MLYYCYLEQKSSGDNNDEDYNNSSINHNKESNDGNDVSDNEYRMHTESAKFQRNYRVTSLLQRYSHIHQNLLLSTFVYLTTTLRLTLHLPFPWITPKA